jgi:hypothetical protein
MVQKLVVRLGLSLVLFVALLSAAVSPVAAAGPLSVTVDGVVAGSMVRLIFTNLPANSQFAISMGPSGVAGKYMPLVAHMYSSDGRVVASWFEILDELRDSPRIDVRVDNGAGLATTVSFDNSKSYTAPTIVVPETPAAVVQTVANRGMSVLHVQQGGIVVASIKNLPANTRFDVTVGKAGTQGFGGNLVGHLDNGSVVGQDAIGYFEIPTNLATEKTLDLRLEAPGYLYLATFNNTTY